MNKIKISTALDKVSELKQNLSKLSKRVVANASYRTDKQPEFSFSEDLENYRKTAIELTKLQAKIARANSVFSVKVPENWKQRISEEKVLLAEAVRYYSEMKSEIALIESLSTRSGDEKQVDCDYDGDKRVRVVETVVWFAEVSEKMKDEMLTELNEMLRSMNAAIKAVNNIKTI